MLVATMIIATTVLLCRRFGRGVQRGPRRRPLVAGDVLRVRRNLDLCWPWRDDVIAVVLLVRPDDALILTWSAGLFRACGGDLVDLAAKGTLRRASESFRRTCEWTRTGAIPRSRVADLLAETSARTNSRWRRHHSRETRDMAAELVGAAAGAAARTPRPQKGDAPRPVPRAPCPVPRAPLASSTTGMREGDLIQYDRGCLGLLVESKRVCDGQGSGGGEDVRAVDVCVFLPEGQTERHDPCCTLHVVRIGGGRLMLFEHRALVVRRNLTREMCARKIQRWWRVHRQRAELLRVLPRDAAELVLGKLREAERDDREDVWLHGYRVPPLF